MLLSGKSPIVDFQVPFGIDFAGNKTHIKYPKNKQLIFRLTVKLMLATITFVGMGLAGIVTLEKILQPGVTIADGNISGCEHRDGCFPNPETY